MKAKDKVLKIYPNAVSKIAWQSGKSKDWCIVKESGSRETLSGLQNRESWAWAEAYRNLTSNKIC